MSNKMWGGRFADKPDAIMEEINASIDFDKHLYRQDIRASKAHAAMLAKQGIIGAKDAAAIIRGLDAISAEIEAGSFTFSLSASNPTVIKSRYCSPALTSRTFSGTGASIASTSSRIGIVEKK